MDSQRKKMSLKQKLAKKRTGLRPNRDEHYAEKCSIINYFSDRENTELILLRREFQVENSCIYCDKSEKCKKLQECKNEFKKMSFWTFNKHIFFDETL